MVLKTRFASARASLELLRNVAYDVSRFRRASFLAAPRSRENFKAQIHILAHMIEYGMALSDPRAGFGLERVRTLCAETKRYLERFGADRTSDIALGVIAAYVAFNAARATDVGDVPDSLATLEALAGDREQVGGAEVVAADDIRAAARVDFLRFMEARHSVRQYAPRPVEPDRLQRAVAAAQQTPSSCNRQTCRVYAFTDKALVARVVALHNGNRGFGDQLGGVCVVTSDLCGWNDVSERNQGFVDGGMFAMTLALALHAEGLGAVMMNWSATRERDVAMRSLIGVPDNEIIITLIGFGHMPDEFRVPVSRRKELAAVLSLNPPLHPA